jgi:UDP-N-acetylmuramate--alanine ligase
VVDDYAHHPTELEATLRAARDAFPGRRTVAVFQPHLYSRTRAFAREFADALGAADLVVVTGVYAAREDPDPTVDARTVVDLVRPGAATAVEDRLEAARAVADAARPGDLVLTVGAGDVTELAPVVLERLRAAAGGPEA